jgi:transcriptional regulator with XRE-family HTH domain
MTLAQRVRDHRYTKGWGPDELASRAEISRTALYQIESGKTELPRAGTLRRIAMALDVPMEALLGYEDEGSSALSSFATTYGPRKARKNVGWIPSEGGPLTTLSPKSDASMEDVGTLRFGAEALTSPSKSHDVPSLPRERELFRKFHELLSSPLGEGIARIVEESHRMIPLAGSATR